VPASSTVTNLQPILKKIYERLDKDQLYSNKPFFTMLKKDKNFVGETLEVPIRHSPEPGGSATFASALNNRGPSGFRRFAVTRRKDYAIGSIETELVRAAASNSGSVISAIEAVIRGLRNTAERATCKGLFGNGGGARAQVASGMASNTITLVNPKDIVWFEVGMVLDGSVNDGTSGSATTGGAAAKIVSIDRDAGTLTNDGSANWNAASGINALAANWYLFRQGDFGLTFHGLDAWIPETVPSAPFFGVNRQVDGERLAGCRITPTTPGYTYSTIEGAITAALERVYMAGGAPDVILLHPQRYKRLCDELGAKRQYVDIKTDAGVSFKGIMVEGQGGQATVVSDPCCQRDVGWALTMNTWKFSSLGDLFSPTDDDKNEIWMRETNDDAIQIRLATYGNLICNAPAHNGRFSLAGIALWLRDVRRAPFVTRRPTRNSSRARLLLLAPAPRRTFGAQGSPWCAPRLVAGRSRSRASPSARWSRSPLAFSSTRPPRPPPTCWSSATWPTRMGTSPSTSCTARTPRPRTSRPTPTTASTSR
jgi:hypothetical protein